MTTAAKAAYGVTFKWNAVIIAELTNIGGVEISVDMLDVTTHSSATRFKEFIAGLADAGEIAIEGFFKYTDSTGQLAMVTDAAAGTEREAIITFPGSIATWTFDALISKVKIGDTPVDGQIPFSASVKVTGSPVLATSASNNITALTVTTATLYPTFSAATYEYSATSVGDTATFAATFAAGTCTLSAGGVDQELTSTVASSAVALGSNGDMTEVTLTVQETGKTPKVYTIWVANTSA